jgi:hypothetical protein
MNILKTKDSLGVRGISVAKLPGGRESRRPQAVSDSKLKTQN